jgi:sugar-specific transcriptional regulator TrmB
MATTASEDVVESLRRLGLARYEASAYRALLDTGRASAASVAAAARVPPTRIHDVLKSLETKGWIVSSGGRPKSYEPRPPRETIKRGWSRIAEENERVASELDLAYRGRAVAASEPVWFLRGDEAVKDRALELASSARRELFVLLAFSQPHDAELFEVLAAAARKGRRVRVVLGQDVARARRSRLPVLRAAGAEVRVGGIPTRIVIRDFAEGLTVPPPADPTQDQARGLWIPIRDIMELMRPSMEAVWRESEAARQ